jgi:hypothetical protein
LGLRLSFSAGNVLQARHIQQEFQQGEPRRDPGILGHEAYTFTVASTHGTYRFSAEKDLSPVGSQILGKQVHQGAFAASVGAQKGVDANVQVTGEILQRFDLLIGFGEILNRKKRRHVITCKVFPVARSIITV